MLHKRITDLKLNSGKKRKRECLKCGVIFLSYGIHNRICMSCKNQREWQDGGAYDEFAVHICRRKE
jgi:hypothetical protein